MEEKFVLELVLEINKINHNITKIWMFIKNLQIIIPLKIITKIIENQKNL